MTRIDYYPLGFSPIRWIVVAACITTGIAARLYCSGLGENHDGIMWRDCVTLLHTHGELALYNGFGVCTHYNYSPVWANVLLILSWLPFSLPTATTLLLSACDLGIAALLWRWYSGWAAILFWLNPISIFVSGYHRQFDCVALFVGLLAIGRMR